MVFCLLMMSCKNSLSNTEQTKVKKLNHSVQDSLDSFLEDVHEKRMIQEPDTLPVGWAEILRSEPGVTLALQYADTINFTKQKIYDCPRCFLRPEVKSKLLQFRDHLRDNYGVGIIIYDCYRPRPYQQQLWDIKPDPRFVTHPDKGSMHTRGMAVDIGLTTATGKLLDMGSDFDHFGKVSYHSATGISKEAIKNRKLLKKEIGKFGFKPITSEWWHYSYRQNVQPLSDWIWPCK